jgi:hypothetical protein
MHSHSIDMSQKILIFIRALLFAPNSFFTFIFAIYIHFPEKSQKVHERLTSKPSILGISHLMTTSILQLIASPDIDQGSAFDPRHRAVRIREEEVEEDTQAMNNNRPSVSTPIPPGTPLQMVRLFWNLILYILSSNKNANFSIWDFPYAFSVSSNAIATTRRRYCKQYDRCPSPVGTPRGLGPICANRLR